MPILLKIIESSFMNAILISRCEFSITLAASATLILSALCTPASTTSSYVAEIASNDSASIPETILVIVSNRWILSPGLIRSGEYPILKSFPHFKPDSISRIGTHISSVTPG